MQLINVMQAATVLGVSPATVRNLKDLPVVRTKGNHRRFNLFEVLAYKDNYYGLSKKERFLKRLHKLAQEPDKELARFKAGSLLDYLDHSEIGLALGQFFE